MELIYTRKLTYRNEKHDTTHNYSTGISFPQNSLYGTLRISSNRINEDTPEEKGRN
jgi:hypothetical protein